MQDILKDDLNYISQNSIVISNPPYIKTQDIKSLELSVKNFEPHLALDGGISGLKFYQTLAKKCKNAKFIIIEVGFDIVHDVKSLFIKEGYFFISPAKDLGGIERVLVFFFNIIYLNKNLFN